MSEQINPYEPPKAEIRVSDSPSERRRGIGCLRGSLGCGCLLPAALFVLCAISGDTGGPLIWPMMVLLGGFVGGMIGAAFWAPYAKRKD